MLMIIFIVMAASIWIEFKLIMRFDVVKNFIGKSKLCGLILSLAISWCLGTLFGAGGIIIMAAGIGSTMLGEPARRFLNKTEKREKQIATVQHWSTEATETYKPLLFILKWIGIIISCPVWIPVYIHAEQKKRAANKIPEPTKLELVKNIFYDAKKQAAA